MTVIAVKHITRALKCVPSPQYVCNSLTTYEKNSESFDTENKLQHVYILDLLKIIECFETENVLFFEQESMFAVLLLASCYSNVKVWLQ